jgi:hypothetical protein
MSVLFSQSSFVLLRSVMAQGAAIVESKLPCTDDGTGLPAAYRGNFQGDGSHSAAPCILSRYLVYLVGIHFKILEIGATPNNGAGETEVSADFPRSA